MRALSVEELEFVSGGFGFNGPAPDEETVIVTAKRRIEGALEAMQLSGRSAMEWFSGVADETRELLCNNQAETVVSATLFGETAGGTIGSVVGGVGGATGGGLAGATGGGAIGTVTGGPGFGTAGGGLVGGALGRSVGGRVGAAVGGTVGSQSGGTISAIATTVALKAMCTRFAPF